MEETLNIKNNTMIEVLSIKTPLLLLAGISFAWFSIEYVPSLMLFIYLLAAMLVDGITGLLKSWRGNQVSTSKGFQQSVIKVFAYCGSIVMITIMVNVIGLVDDGNKYDLAIVINGLMGFIIFIELYSICENISKAYPNSPLTKYFISYIMKFLRGKFESLKPQVDENIENKKPKPPFDPFPID